ncbi:MAG TPA: ornithine--oxo-acid transaminase [Actinomycetes bacterium]|nr:ornithine--oxo-acid transaminase [Actinomycetes bacterium]
MNELIELAEGYSAHNYQPLPLVVAEAEGAWVTDIHGRRYLDLVAAYSALNFGHRHPRLLQAAHAQLERVTLTSRAVYHDRFGPFCKALAELCAMEAVLLMNTGAEAVETAIKTARKWGYEVKGVPPDRAKIIACRRNFHGRTITLVSFSTDPLAHDHYGPYTPGFEVIGFGDADALRAAIDDDTVAFLVEPIQGEAGVIVPPPGYVREIRDICTQAGILLIADEIQTGLGRTGRTFACQHEDVQPDIYVLGKGLGGGIVPLSAVVSTWEVLGVFGPGEHGSTFGGNPLACAVGLEVCRLLGTGEFQDRAAALGARLLDGLRAASLPGVKEVRGQGLWAGIELAAGMPPARAVCEQLLNEELFVKDTQRTTLRLAPTLVITEAELDLALERITRVLAASNTGA